MGNFTLFNILFETWVYISVVLELECPAIFWMIRKSVPDSSKLVKDECLKVCIDEFLSIYFL